ncbi:hypothetical protein K438DRAFT_1766500 [Mycena galopus ATCC 62051]|nr:hypothetical protein K438DRAFT_1766500 [Mycena galopus ATCC 62051]
MATTAVLVALGYAPPTPTLSHTPQRLCDLKFVNPATVFGIAQLAAQLVVPECLRASVYIPPSFIAQHPDTHPAIAHLAQHFIEHFGTRTVSRWTELARLRWSLDQPGRGTRNPPNPPLIPQPKNRRRAKYLFFGRPVGSLEHLPLLTARPAMALALIDISDLDESDDDQDLGTNASRSRTGGSGLTAHNRLHGASSKSFISRPFRQYHFPPLSLAIRVERQDPALQHAIDRMELQPSRAGRISAPPPYSPADISHAPTARDLEAAVTLLNLAQHRAVIRLVVQNFPLSVWQEKLVESGVPEEAAHVLCEVLAGEAE